VVQEKKRIQQIEEKEKRKKAILEEKKMNDSVVDFNFDPSDTKRVLRRLAKLTSVYDILSENGKRANCKYVYKEIVVYIIFRFIPARSRSRYSGRELSKKELIFSITFPFFPL